MMDGIAQRTELAASSRRMFEWSFLAIGPRSKQTGCKQIYPISFSPAPSSYRSGKEERGEGGVSVISSALLTQSPLCRSFFLLLLFLLLLAMMYVGCSCNYAVFRSNQSSCRSRDHSPCLFCQCLYCRMDNSPRPDSQPASWTRDMYPTHERIRPARRSTSATTHCNSASYVNTQKGRGERENPQINALPGGSGHHVGKKR